MKSGDRDGDGILILRGNRDSVTSRVETRTVVFAMHCFWIVTADGCVTLWRQNEIAGAMDKTPILTHCGRVTQICVFSTVKLGTAASSP